MKTTTRMRNARHTGQQLFAKLQHGETKAERSARLAREVVARRPAPKTYPTTRHDGRQVRVTVPEREPDPLACERWAAVRHGPCPALVNPNAIITDAVRRCGRLFVRLSGDAVGCSVHGIRFSETIDLSTLSETADGARALADRRDAQNRMAIRRGEMLPVLRVARVQIEEVR